MPENDRIELGKVITNSLHSKGKKVMATIAQALHKEGVNEGILIGKARGEAIGEARGEGRGKLEGKLELLTSTPP